MTTATIPAAVRHRNPSAMGLGKSAKLFGATTSTVLNDGAGNTIATFPTMVDGAGALFYLLRSPSYCGMTIWDAMHKWGDGATLEKKGRAHEARARTDGYVKSIEAHSRFKGTDFITAELLESPETGIEFGKAMARHETGEPYPMTDAQWREAHAEFMTVLKGGHIQLDRVKPVPVLGPLKLLTSHLGERRIAGKDHNDFIVECFKEIGSSYRNDETAHCAAVLSAMLKRTGCAYIEGNAGCGARNYLKYGHALDEPEEGCIVVFWRESPSAWEGHVALLESWTATTLVIVGANQQGGAVTRMTVPRTGPKSQVLGYRRPVPNVVPALAVAKDESIQRKAVGGIGAVSAFLWSVWDSISGAAHFVGELVGILPETAATANSAVATGQTLAQSAGVPWPLQLGLFITVCALGFGAYATWKRLRPATGALTTPPYETDDTPIESDDVEDVFGASVVSLEAERTKRKAKPKAPARKSAKRRAA